MHLAESVQSNSFLICLQKWPKGEGETSFKIRVIENTSHTEKIIYFWTGLKCEASPQKNK